MTSTFTGHTQPVHAASQSELASHLDELERLEAASDGRQHRRAIRFRFEEVVHCAASYGGEIEGDVLHQVVARNVSDYGLAVLQVAEVAVGTPTRVRLRLLDDQTAVIDGHVRRCRRLASKIYDVGIEFDRRVSARAFVISSP
ncbi:MAG: PilZ domain-containing protein [Planctomycetota bacterium]